MCNVEDTNLKMNKIFILNNFTKRGSHTTKETFLLYFVLTFRINFHITRKKEFLLTFLRTQKNYYLKLYILGFLFFFFTGFLVYYCVLYSERAYLLTNILKFKKRTSGFFRTYYLFPFTFVNFSVQRYNLHLASYLPTKQYCIYLYVNVKKYLPGF